MTNGKLSVKALAFSVAVLWGGTVLIVGLINIAQPAYGSAFLQMASSIYPGYHALPTIGSVLVGSLYGVLDGAIGGALLAWLYNLCACRKCEVKEAP